VGWSNEIPNPFVVGGGVAGEIDIVDAQGRLIIQMNQDGITVYDSSTGDVKITIDPSGVFKSYVGGILDDFLFLNAAQLIWNNNTATRDSEIISTFGDPLDFEIIGGSTNADGSAPQIVLRGGSGGNFLYFLCQDNFSSKVAFDVVTGGIVKATNPTGSLTQEETWHTATLQNGWTVPASQNAPAYRLQPDGTVEMRGWTTGGTKTDGTILLNLPAGYRPTNNYVFFVPIPFVNTAE
jgi:hypothetical protein